MVLVIVKVLIEEQIANASFANYLQTQTTCKFLVVKQLNKLCVGLSARELPIS